jgi:nuclear pore complex protein Nup93
MLGGPRCLQEPLLSVDIEDPQPMRRLNIARLIMLYVKKFEITDPSEALQYFFFLRTLKDADGRNLFLVCVIDLAIECRSFDLLLGKMQRDGVRSRGLIDQFENTYINTRMACEMIAEEFIKKGLFEDAIKMFDLAGDHEQALRYTTTLLSQLVHQTTKPGSLRERLQIMAAEFTERYTGAERNCDHQTWTSFNTLKELLVFFDKYHEKNYQFAMEILAKTRLIPLSMAELDHCVSNFKRLSGEVCKVIPDLLLATMDILYHKYKSLKSKDLSTFEDSGREKVGQMERQKRFCNTKNMISLQQLVFIREQAKALTNMAATVPYRMPGDTNNRLVQTEILMH